MENILLAMTVISLLIWIYLLIFRGQFWLANQKVELESKELIAAPSVCIIIPARNEADVLPISLKSLLAQDYSGEFSIILVDDQSEDGTGEVAKEVAKQCQKSDKLIVVLGQPLPSGWSGKLWAIEQGIRLVKQQNLNTDYLLLTDADIEHHSTNLKELVAEAEAKNLALVSLMVRLKTETFWEQFLIPAFVFFFQKLYPFSWVNNPKRKMAAAAGGCILIRSEVLDKIGGIESVKNALIDDCSLASQVKSYLQSHPEIPFKGIWLGLSEKTKSLRSYDSLDTIWNMVARTAYTQLYYSPLLLLGTVFSMIIVYLVPPMSLMLGLLIGNNLIASLGLLSWLLMTVSYLPTLRLYQLSPLWGLSLPIIAFLYTLMTIDSAIRHWQGKGGGWKGRVYSINQ